MKLKVVKRNVEDVETDLDLPIYLLYQDELGYHELVKITDKEKIIIKNSRKNVTITVETEFFNEDINYKHFLTTESIFIDEYKDALQYINDRIL
jgi:hypothetical protein